MDAEEEYSSWLIAFWIINLKYVCFCYIVSYRFSEVDKFLQTFFQGKNLNVVLTKHDFRVTIGDVNCSVTSISSSQLTCLPSELNSILPDAPVKVGYSLRAWPLFPKNNAVRLQNTAFIDDVCGVRDAVVACWCCCDAGKHSEIK